eukprot:4466-Heterococcus_DN1.PRE.1
MRCLSGSCSSKSKTCAHVTAAGGAATSIGTTQSSKADTPTIDPTGPVNMQRQSTSVIPHYREDAPEVWDRMQAVLAQRHHGISGTASRYPSELCPHAYCEQACTHCYKPMLKHVQPATIWTLSGRIQHVPMVSYHCSSAGSDAQCSMSSITYDGAEDALFALNGTTVFCYSLLFDQCDNITTSGRTAVAWYNAVLLSGVRHGNITDQEHEQLIDHGSHLRSTFNTAMQQFILARASLIAIVKGEKDVFSP